MMNILRRVLPGPEGWLDALLAPAEDPREAYADAQQRQQELLAKVHRAQARLASSRKRLEASIEEGTNNLSLLEEQAGRAGPENLALFARQLRLMAAEELRSLEAQLEELQQEEAVLSLVEQRLVAETDALRSRHEVLDARHSTAEAQVSAREALGNVSDELADLDLALERAEQRSEEMRAKASAIDHLVELGMAPSRHHAAGDTRARRLAHRYALEASDPEMATLDGQLQSGLDVLRRLVYEYEQLRPVLEGHREPAPLAVAHIPALAEETYRQGIGVLEDALHLALATRSPSEEQVEAEIRKLRSAIEALEADTAESDRLAALRLLVASGGERLRMLKGSRVRIDELIGHASQCEASLQRVRIELAGMKVSSATWSVEVVTERLLNTLRQAREVHEELNRDGAG